MTEREHGSRDLREPLDIVARAEAAVRGAIDEAARAVCAEASAKEAVRLMTEAETQTALAEALRASRRREEALAARISVLERDRAARISVGSRGPPSIIPSAAREAILAKAASREAILERGDGLLPIGRARVVDVVRAWVLLDARQHERFKFGLHRARRPPGARAR